MSTISTTHAAQLAERRANAITTKIAQSLLMIQQHDLLTTTTTTTAVAVAVSSCDNKDDKHDKHDSNQPQPTAPTTTMVNVAATTVRPELSISEQLLLLFRTDRGKLPGHATVFGDQFAFANVIVVAGGLAELIVMGHISIRMVTETHPCLLWGTLETQGALIVLNESTAYLPTGNPALDEIKSNINLATLRQSGDLLDPLMKSTDRTVEVKKFLRQFFVSRHHSYEVTKSMLGTMVEHQILAPRTIRCGLFKIWKRTKYEDTKMTAAVLGDVKQGLRSVVNSSTASSLSSKITLRLLADAQYLQNVFYYCQREQLLNKVFTKEEITQESFGAGLASALSVDILAEVTWNPILWSLRVVEMDERKLWSLCSEDAVVVDVVDESMLKTEVPICQHHFIVATN